MTVEREKYNLQFLGDWNIDGGVVARFFYPHHNMTLDQANEELAKRGCRAAARRELGVLMLAVNGNLLTNFPRALGMSGFQVIFTTGDTNQVDHGHSVPAAFSNKGQSTLGSILLKDDIIWGHGDWVIMAIVQA